MSTCMRGSRRSASLLGRRLGRAVLGVALGDAVARGLVRKHLVDHHVLPTLKGQEQQQSAPRSDTQWQSVAIIASNGAIVGAMGGGEERAGTVGGGWAISGAISGNQRRSARDRARIAISANQRQSAAQSALVCT